jgi:hypothetical protein
MFYQIIYTAKVKKKKNLLLKINKNNTHNNEEKHRFKVARKLVIINMHGKSEKRKIRNNKNETLRI